MAERTRFEYMAYYPHQRLVDDAVMGNLRAGGWRWVRTDGHGVGAVFEREWRPDTIEDARDLLIEASRILDELGKGTGSLDDPRERLADLIGDLSALGGAS